MKKLLKVLLGVVIVVSVGFIGLTIASQVKLKQVNNALSNGVIDEVNISVINGFDMAYRLQGDAEAEVIVLIHGFLGSSYDYRYLIESLSEEYYVVAIDLIGFGHSDKPVDFNYTPSVQASYVLQLLNQLEIENYHLVGHSMGAIVAMFQSTMDQNHINTLTLIAPPAFNQASREAPPTIFYDFIFNNYYLQRLGFRSVHYSDAFKTSDYFDPMFYFTSMIPSKVLRQMTLSEETEDLIPKLETLMLQTLIIYGKEDTWTPPEIGNNYERQLQNATYIKVEAAGHLPMIEKAFDVYQIMQVFLETPAD